MMLSRRSFLTVSTLATAGLALPARRSLAGFWQPTTKSPAAAPTTYFEWSKVADGCHVAMGEGGNAMALLAKGETLVIDAKNGGFGAVLRREAAALGSPVTMLINTHHHADHTGGNPAFTRDLTVLGHANMLPRIAGNVERCNKSAQGAIAQLKQSPKPAAAQVIADIEALLTSAPAEKDFRPTKTIPSSGNISVGGVNIELYHVGPGHTDNDLIVYIPEHNLIHSGDLCFNKMWPYVDIANSGADSAGWIKGCQKIIDLCNDKTVVIPGHGPVGDVGIAKRQIEFFTKMREAASQAIKKGTPREDFLKTSPDEYKDYTAADSIRPITLGGLYDEAKKENGK